MSYQLRGIQTDTAWSTAILNFIAWQAEKKKKVGGITSLNCFEGAHKLPVSLHMTCIIKYPLKNKVPCASDIPAWETSSSSWTDKRDCPLCILGFTSALFQSFAANLILPAHPVHVFSLLSFVCLNCSNKPLVQVCTPHHFTLEA